MTPTALLRAPSRSSQGYLPALSTAHYYVNATESPRDHLSFSSLPISLNLKAIGTPALSILLSTACLHIPTSNMARNRAANDDSKNDHTNGKEKGGNGNGKGRKVAAVAKPDPKTEAVSAGDSSTSQTGNPNVRVAYLILVITLTLLQSLVRLAKRGCRYPTGLSRPIHARHPHVFPVDRNTSGAQQPWYWPTFTFNDTETT